MKTYSFAINGEVTDASLTRVLPDNFTINGKRFLKVGGYNCVDHCGNEHDAPDIVLVPGYRNDGDKTTPLQLPTRTVMGGLMVPVFRHNKGVYNHILNNLFKNKPGFKEILVYSKPEYVPWAGGEYIFRTPHGARGTGFGKIPEGRTPSWVSTKLALARKEKDLTKAKEVGISIEPDSHIEVEKQDATKLDNTYWNQYVEFVPNIKTEYRLLTDYKGAFSIGVLRNRVERSNGLTMAVGSEALPEDIFNLTEDVAHSRGDGMLAAIIPHLKPIPYMPIHSFDLFITEDNRWGFFEASCEFGDCAIPRGWLINQAKLYMSALADCLQENNN